MSGSEDEQSSNPKFWLEFGTFDDGLPPLADTALTPPFDEFPQFAQLPAELRLKIWTYLIQPRIVVASCLQRDDRLAHRQHELQRRTHGTAAPVLLRVNHEARHLALGHYEQTFGWRISRLLSDTPVSRPPLVWFNFAMDALYLTGELEAYDEYGFNSPMVYFLRREDTRRVRHVACAFAELGYPRQESDQIFGCLWHVADRFQGVKRLLLTVGEGDEAEMRGSLLRSTDNVMQKIWNGWMGGTTVTSSSMADKQMLLVREEDLAEVIAASDTVME